MSQPQWLTLAWADLGTTERPGPAHNAKILSYYAEIGHASVADDETAWCAAFLGACLERAGFASTRSLMARSYLAWGEPQADFRHGAIAVLSRGADPTLGHVGFLVGETGDSLILLGGNQGDAVSVEAFPRGRLLGLLARLRGRVLQPRHPGGRTSADPGSSPEHHRHLRPLPCPRPADGRRLLGRSL